MLSILVLNHLSPEGPLPSSIPLQQHSGTYYRSILLVLHFTEYKLTCGKVYTVKSHVADTFFLSIKMFPACPTLNSSFSNIWKIILHKLN